jgi:hypothetical protein
MIVPLSAPISSAEIARYRVKPREKRFFNTALDANDLFVSPESAKVEYGLVDGEIHLDVNMPVSGGRFHETCTFDRKPFRPGKFSRVLSNGDGSPIREEKVDFRAPVPRLPEATYPETLLPFLLRGQSLGKDRRSLYAWICDRFVAKVYYEIVHERTEVRVPAGTFRAREIIMYPDLNDWVKLPGILTKLAKPFLPKYHMWFDEKLIRFEGPYGPPGAPEIVLELV